MSMPVKVVNEKPYMREKMVGKVGKVGKSFKNKQLTTTER